MEFRSLGNILKLTLKNLENLEEKDTLPNLYDLPKLKLVYIEYFSTLRRRNIRNLPTKKSLRLTAGFY